MKNLPYINFDDERLFDFTSKDFDLLLQAFYELYGDFDYVVLDEPHNIQGWELFVNRLRRTKKVIITGSNSNLLSGELATHLTGRYIDFTLFPFSFREFLKFYDFSLSPEDAYSTKKEAQVKKFLDDYLSAGGFPERLIFGREILVRIYSDIIEKDILTRYKIKKKKTFKELTRYLISNFSSEISFNKLKNIFGIKDVHTLKNWISFLESAYLIFILERFSFKLKEQFIAPKKVYCIDTGLAGVIGYKLMEDKGKLMENLVAVELLRRKSYWNNSWEIYYWKDHQQNEVDFVIKEGKDVVQLIQVCYDIEMYKTKEREIKSLLKASKELRCDNLTIINWDYYGEEEVQNQLEKGKKSKKFIKFIPLWRWLIEVEK
ncbi:MAG: ATP-binding protein [Candidatus Calescibacterium sp.]|nr:ATP-binding protein [Candidatus Calescibacterium sp.]